MSERMQAIVERAPRVILDAVTDFRGWSGEPMADHLAVTPPEDRTGGEAAVVAGIGVTDFWDGIVGRLIGPDGDSTERDRRADRNFVIPQQEALALNGEIPMAHYVAKLLRESGMEQMRDWAEPRGIDIKSSQGGRRKTTAEMGTLVTAHSPLAKRPDLIRWEQSISTGFSLVDLVETGFKFMGQRNGQKEVTTARNSKAREVTAGPFDKVAGLIHRVEPRIKSSQITKLGERMVEFSDFLILVDSDKPALATTIYTIGSLLDAIDGAHARITGEDGLEGALDDVKADLKQQIATLAALSLVAHRRGNEVAATNYALATMTVAMSAYYRAEAESQGLIVAEGKLGTRVGRGIMAGVGMGLNKHRDTSDIVSGMIIAAQVNTVEERRHVVKHGRDSRYCIGVNQDPEFMEDARKRREAIEPFVKISMAIGATLLANSGYPLVTNEGR